MRAFLAALLLTPDELEQMKALNPKSPDELREEQEIQEFLRGTKIRKGMAKGTVADFN